MISEAARRLILTDFTQSWKQLVFSLIGTLTSVTVIKLMTIIKQYNLSCSKLMT